MPIRALVAWVLLAVLPFAVEAQEHANAPAKATIDLQYSLCGPPGPIERALALQPRGTPFEVWLFDDPTLALFDQGLRLRLRGGKGGDELTLKVADVDCAARSAGALRTGEGKCEYDQHGDRIAGALSLTHRVGADTAAALSGGRLPVAQALGAAQKRELQSRPGVWPLRDDIRALGPTRVTSYRTRDKRYAVDVSELPGGETFIEISRKVPLAKAGPERTRFEADLARAEVPVCADQSAQAVNKLRALLRRP